MYRVLERLMQEHGETPADLSRATGIPQNTISNWKARGGGVSIANMARIASHYGLTLEQLMNLTENKEE